MLTYDSLVDRLWSVVYCGYEFDVIIFFQYNAAWVSAHAHCTGVQEAGLFTRHDWTFIALWHFFVLGLIMGANMKTPFFADPWR